jgi:septal ring factor EnvC (AmiA/AmiB activator)
MEVSANREMLEVAFDQIDANIARLDKYGKEIASLSKRTGDLEILASTLEDQVDSLTSITNTMAKQMYKLDKTKADKADLAAAEKRISSLEANDTVIEEKLLALEATQKQNITNTNAAIILSFVALAFGAVGLILK